MKKISTYSPKENVQKVYRIKKNKPIENEKLKEKDLGEDIKKVKVEEERVTIFTIDKDNKKVVNEINNDTNSLNISKNKYKNIVPFSILFITSCSYFFVRKTNMFKNPMVRTFYLGSSIALIGGLSFYIINNRN